MGEYYVIYKAEEIRKMAEKYLLEGRQNDVNLMHQEGSDVDGVQMVQYFIKGDGIQVDGFDDCADGSLFGEFHVVNDSVWEEIKAGTYKGFSLEGVFDLVPEQDKDEIQEIVDLLDGAFKRIFKPNTFMSKLSKFKAALAKMLQEFGNVTTDKGIISWDGDEDLKAGDAVYITDEEGNRNPAPDGDYTTEDGKVIKVADGKVTEIVDSKAEVSEEEVKAKRITKFNKIKQAFEESFDTKIRKISNAIAAVIDTENFYLVDAGEDFGVVETWNEDWTESHYFRYAITWNEDGTAKAADSVEVKLMFVPMDMESPFAKGNEEEMAALKAENASLKKEIAKLKKTPAAKPAHEEVKEQTQFTKTGNKGLDNLQRILSAK